MKKILFVINTMDRAGAEISLLELLKRIPSNKFHVYLYVLTGQGELVDELPANVQLLNKEYDKCSVHSKRGRFLLFTKILSSLFLQGNIINLFPYLFKNTVSMLKNGHFLSDKLMWRVLADGAEVFDDTFDIAVSYIEGGSAYYVSRHVKACKKIAFLHIDFDLAGYSRLLDDNCYLEYNKVYAISEEVKSTFEKVYPECKGNVDLFHNFINRSYIIQKSKEGAGFNDDYNGLRIVTLGRLTAQKNFAVSVKAMKILKEHGVDARWYILGEGNQRRKLERLIKKLQLEDSFFLPGIVSNPFVFLRQADIYVHATSYEGISIAVREAQVLGKAMVVSDCKGNRELVCDGVDGLVRDFTPESIAEGIISLAENKELRMKYGNEALKRYECEEDNLVFLQEG